MRQRAIIWSGVVWGGGLLAAVNFMGQSIGPVAQASAGDQVESRRGPVPLALWGAASALAVLGAAIGFDAAPGVNWTIWTWLAGAGMIVAAARGRGPAPGVVVCVGLAALLAVGAAITTADLLVALICLGIIVLLATSVRLASDVPLDALGPVAIALGPPVEGIRTVLESGTRVGDVGRALTGDGAHRVVRGLLIAIPVAGVFALLLSGADPVLEAWREAIVRLLREVEILPRLVFGVAVGVCVLGAYGLALRGVRPRADRARSALLPRLGVVERAVVAWSVVAVFGVWVVLQLSYLFLNTARLRVSGMTYAEYVHRGFGELTIAATGCVLLLVALDALSDRVESTVTSESRVRWAMLVLVAEVVCVLVSAYWRVAAYEATYGYTVARVYVQVYVAGVAIALGLLAWELRQAGVLDVRRWVRRVGAAGVVVVVLCAVANIDAAVVRRNAERYRERGTIDEAYLASTDWDGIPAVVAALPSLAPACADTVRRRLQLDHYYQLHRAEDRRWYEWNLRAERAIAAFRSAGLDVPPAPVVPRSESVPAISVCGGR